jgi:hypothetical protein
MSLVLCLKRAWSLSLWVNEESQVPDPAKGLSGFLLQCEAAGCAMCWCIIIYKLVGLKAVGWVWRLYKPQSSGACRYDLYGGGDGFLAMVHEW